MPKHVIDPIDLFEAGVRLTRAHNKVMQSGAYAERHCDDHSPYYSEMRGEYERAQRLFNQGVIQAKTAAALPEYARGLGWM